MVNCMKVNLMNWLQPTIENTLQTATPADWLLGIAMRVEFSSFKFVASRWLGLRRTPPRTGPTPTEDRLPDDDAWFPRDYLNGPIRQLPNVRLRCPHLSDIWSRGFLQNMKYSGRQFIDFDWEFPPYWPVAMRILLAYLDVARGGREQAQYS